MAAFFLCLSQERMTSCRFDLQIAVTLSPFLFLAFWRLTRRDKNGPELSMSAMSAVHKKGSKAPLYRVDIPVR
jgi:hypothetical protein